MFKTALFAIFLICIGVLLTVVLVSIIVFFMGKRLFRSIVQRLFGLVMGRLLSDDYAENLMELWSAVRRSSVLNILEQSLRAETGTIIKRPLGSSKHFNHYDNLLFVPAQMTRLPLNSEFAVDVQVSLGPKAETPLNLKTPLLISGMGYGVALSEESRLALAKGAKLAGTALNSGEGPFLKEERELTDKYIWQIGRGSWGRDPQAIAAADMIEVQMG